VLLALFVRIETHATEPVLPLRLLTHPTRNTANAARGLIYAGMYAMFFFLSQFLQDIQHFSPLQAGVAFLPMPTSVFLSSQFASRVLVRRLPQRIVMLTGAALVAASMLLATQLHAGTPYGQIVVSLVLMGAGAGISFVSLTSASLADVAPEDAGAASGLINVSQQIGAALGLAVLVSAFGALSGHVQLGGRLAAAQLHSLVAGLDHVFAIGALFALAALVLVAVKVRPPVLEPCVVPVEAEEWEAAA
jgi:predicted MFS family arabinose efflux permease